MDMRAGSLQLLRDDWQSLRAVDRALSQVWLSSLIVFGVMILIAAIIALVAVRVIKKAKPPVSREAIFLGKAGAKKDALLKALKEVRGSTRITDPNPEDKYQALKRYTRDLTDLARRGKIDPVIGRDEHQIRPGLPGLADHAGVVHVETDHIRQPPVRAVGDDLL